MKEDAYKLSLDDESVDLVISRRGPDPEDEVFRVLKREGICIFITIGEKDTHSLKEVVGRGQYFGSSDKVSEQLKGKFKNAGFSDVLCKEFLYDDDFSESDYESIDTYCEQHVDDGIKLARHRVVLLARKDT